MDILQVFMFVYVSVVCVWVGCVCDGCFYSAFHSHIAVGFVLLFLHTFVQNINGDNCSLTRS